MIRYFAGVDIGSTTSKAVVIDECGTIIDYRYINTQHDRDASGQQALDLALEKAGLARSDLSALGATGYGRRTFKGATLVMPEIVCHGIGTEALVPGTRTIIDVGGQDSKVIACESGIVTQFEMNDKCAAGTGRFFEVLSKRLLNVSLDELGTMALRSKEEVRLSSMCTVYAETEIVSMLSNGIRPDDISKAIIVSALRRILSMASQSAIKLNEPIVLSGGFANNCAAVPVLEELTGKKVISLENPQLPAPLGVALLACKDYLKNNKA